jgi:hypothetical protein
MKNRIIALGITAMVFAFPFRIAFTGLHETHPMVSMAGFIFTAIGIFTAFAFALSDKKEA